MIGVGGFLGLGEKNVAVDYNYLEKNGSIAPNRITLNMTEQDLRSAPAFNRMSSSNASAERVKTPSPAVIPEAAWRRPCFRIRWRSVARCLQFAPDLPLGEKQDDGDSRWLARMGTPRHLLMQAALLFWW